MDAAHAGTMKGIALAVRAPGAATEAHPPPLHAGTQARLDVEI